MQLRNQVPRIKAESTELNSNYRVFALLAFTALSMTVRRSSVAAVVSAPYLGGGEVEVWLQHFSDKSDERHSGC